MFEKESAMNTFANALEDLNNFGYTENGAVTHLTTKSDVLDMFALCGAYRNRSEEDCVAAFRKAYAENETLALKCLFYLRDILQGQGERRFFRVCFRWLANNHPEAAERNLANISEYGRWDDLIYSTIDTPVWSVTVSFIKSQLAMDNACTTPSLLGKWMPSCNASSETTRSVANTLRTSLGFSQKAYRKLLSSLRQKINVLERLMSENRWDEIEFDKIPSKAGMIYRNAFARRDIIAKKYEAFANDKNTVVNAATLNPAEVVHKAMNMYYASETDIAMIDKYWENLKDYYNGRQENGLCVVDVSGSMTGLPMEAAIGLGMYIAERGHGPFANAFITFSDNPALVKIDGDNIVEKVRRMQRADWNMSTDIEKVFAMLLKAAKREGTRKEDMPERLYIFSDMEFNCATGNTKKENETLLEGIAKEWAREGYELPKVIFWNLDARSQNIPALGKRFSYVSGFSPSMVETILGGKDGYALMLEKLNSKRYEAVK